MLAQLHDHGQYWEEGDPRSDCITCRGTHMREDCARMGCRFCSFDRSSEPPACDYDPRTLTGQPVGQFHCPRCGEVQIAGLAHAPVE